MFSAVAVFPFCAEIQHTWLFQVFMIGTGGASCCQPWQPSQLRQLAVFWQGRLVFFSACLPAAGIGLPLPSPRYQAICVCVCVFVRLCFSCCRAHMPHSRQPEKSRCREWAWTWAWAWAWAVIGRQFDSRQPVRLGNCRIIFMAFERLPLCVKSRTWPPPRLSLNFHKILCFCFNPKM